LSQPNGTLFSLAGVQIKELDGTYRLLENSDKAKYSIKLSQH
jgi:hypothetical protein